MGRHLRYSREFVGEGGRFEGGDDGGGDDGGSGGGVGCG